MQRPPPPPPIKPPACAAPSPPKTCRLDAKDARRRGHRPRLCMESVRGHARTCQVGRKLAAQWRGHVRTLCCFARHQRKDHHGADTRGHMPTQRVFAGDKGGHSRTPRKHSKSSKSKVSCVRLIKKNIYAKQGADRKQNCN